MAVIVFAQAVQNLRQAIMAALPSSTHPYDTEATVSSTPWTVVNIDLPAASARALASTPQAYRVRIRTTILGANSTQTNAIGVQVMTALEGARISPAGWTCGPILQVGSRELGRVDDYTITGSSVHPVVTVLDWQLTASLLP